MRVRAALASACLCVAAASTHAQTASEPEPRAEPAPAPAADAETLPEGEGKAWSFSAAISLYVVPDDHEYLQPTVMADRDWLHLEGRYNYEAQETGSLWLGYNFGGGQEFSWAVTPMIGGVFGETWGVAPGYEATLGWKGLELYSEGEYLFDAEESSDSFFYSWSSLTFSPLEWFRFGIVGQRTRLYDSERDIQRGPLVGFTFKNVDLSAYALDIDDGDPTFVLSVAFSF